MQKETILEYASGLPQEEKNRLIQSLVGEMPVVLNVKLALSSPIQLETPCIISGCTFL